MYLPANEKHKQTERVQPSQKYIFNRCKILLDHQSLNTTVLDLHGTRDVQINKRPQKVCICYLNQNFLPCLETSSNS